jgi:hypothetical protein
MINPGVGTPGLATLRESRVNAANTVLLISDPFL